MYCKARCAVMLFRVLMVHMNVLMSMFVHCNYCTVVSGLIIISCAKFGL